MSAEDTAGLAERIAAVLADALNTDAVGFKDDGWGSNDIDRARLEGIGWVHDWLRDGRAAEHVAAHVEALRDSGQAAGGGD